jgi:D-arabinose 1-dehydrogenase-like Zn-dependent alcohol dehydrogenase
MASSMKAVIFNEHGGIEVLKYTDVGKPTAGEGQVIIKNEYAGVSCSCRSTLQEHRRCALLQACGFKQPLPLIPDNLDF